MTARHQTLAAPVRLLERLRGRRPLPSVEVTLRPWVPGWSIRAATAAAVPTLVLLGAGRTNLLPGIAVALAVAMATWAATRPGPGPAHVAVVVTALLLLGSAAAPFDPAALWLAPLGYAVVRLGWWSAQAGLRARIELDALRHAAARDVVVLGTSVLLGLGAWALAGRPVEALVALGVAALAGLAWTAVRLHDGE